MCGSSDRLFNLKLIAPIVGSWLPFWPPTTGGSPAGGIRPVRAKPPTKGVNRRSRRGRRVVAPLPGLIVVRCSSPLPLRVLLLVRLFCGEAIGLGNRFVQFFGFLASKETPTIAGKQADDKNSEADEYDPEKYRLAPDDCDDSLPYEEHPKEQQIKAVVEQSLQSAARTSAPPTNPNPDQGDTGSLNRNS